MKAAKAVVCRCWLHGYLPALAVVVAWVFSLLVWIIWQGEGAAPVRGAFGKGIIAVDWRLGPNPDRGFGRSDWTLGVMTDRDGKPKPGWVLMTKPWKPLEWEWDPQVHPGHIKVPILPFAVLLSVPPLLATWMRSRRRERYQCQACGYDLRGSSGAVCPECGAVADQQ